MSGGEQQRAAVAVAVPKLRVVGTVDRLPALDRLIELAPPIATAVLAGAANRRLGLRGILRVGAD